jgi:hypothetical protein
MAVNSPVRTILGSFNFIESSKLSSSSTVHSVLFLDQEPFVNSEQILCRSSTRLQPLFEVLMPSYYRDAIFLNVIEINRKFCASRRIRMHVFY